jgi:hypothetical protein
MVVPLCAKTHVVIIIVTTQYAEQNEAISELL